MAIDRRTLLGAGAALFASRQLARAAPDDAYFAELYAKAKQEGEVTWYIASWRTEVAERVAKTFAETWPGIKPNVVRATGQVIYQRLSQDIKAKVPSCDVFSSTDLGHYVALKASRMLLPYEPRNQVHCAEVARAYVPDHAFTIADGNTTVMAYNTNLVSTADAPKKWTDLLDPKWINQVAVAHPGYSGAMGGWVLSMNKLYGWDFFERLKLNKPQIGRSLVDPPMAISSGERKIGISSGSSAGGLNARGSPIQAVYPENETIVSFSPTGLIATSIRPNAAKLFLEFMLSKPAGEIVASEYTIPVRTDVEPAPGIPKFGALKGITKDPNELHAQLPDLIERWRDTFGV